MADTPQQCVSGGQGEDQIMRTAIDELKIRAKQLHKACQRQEPAALAELRKLPAAAPPNVLQLKHCLAIEARKLGFANWARAKAVLTGEQPQDGNWGTVLHPDRQVTGFLNSWFADLAAARVARHQSGDYLLAYKRQYLVVTASYVQAIGLGPDHGAWAELQRDWTRTGGGSARAQLYDQLLNQRVRG